MYFGKKGRVLCALLVLFLTVSLAGFGVNYKLPYPGGVTYRVSQGNNSSFSHTGKARYAFDFAMPVGSDVVTVAAGKVVLVKESSNISGNSSGYANYANYVVIEHADGFRSVYVHLKYNSVIVNVGQLVQQGQKIAESGKTGWATNAHLHFQLQEKGGGSWWEQSVPISFSDVAENGGVPLENHSYASGNYYTAGTPTPSLPSLPPTATILVMDVSGSMGWRWKGGVKIESAKKAALEFIEQVTHEAQTRGGQHKIGVVAFSGGASVLLPLTSDYNRAKQVIISLSATSATNLGAGLVAGLGELNKTPSTTQRFIILLSDGETNTGLSRDQILSGPVVDARRKKICIHTVAFGDPGDVDANFLRKIGIGSGCGSYSHAETAFELFSTYLKLRHRSLGQVVGEYSSIGKHVTILPGVPISLGTVLIGSGKRELHYTLAWSEQGRLQIRLKDPSGRLVNASYPGVQIYNTDQFAHLTLMSPKSGAWTVEAAAGTSMPNGTEYYAVLSTRPGGIAIPLPLPVFTVGDRTFGLPSGLPTWLLVTISVTLIALVLYHELSGK
jgi:murein DD-endopeptidase MepM/ murein hydrolase activator NlpD